MAEEKSWKDIRNQRRKDNFVGRGDEVRTFTENFAEPKYMTFAVTGEGGVGKSTLLKRFTDIATASDIGAFSITCDDRQTSPVMAMGHIAEELSKQGISHKEFDERYKTYLRLRQELESDPNASPTIVKLISMGITDFTIKSLRKTPGVGVFLENVDEKAAGEALGELAQYGINKWGNKDEVQLLREPEKILSPLFLKLIQKAYEKQRLVLMFDVFERTGNILTAWLLAIFNFEYGDFGTKLSFVLGGRDELDQKWTDLAGMICYIRLEPFTFEETQIYLSNQEITNAQLVNQIHHNTGGLPVLVELLASTKPQPGADLPDITEDAVERFLQWTPEEERRNATILAAVPRQFNRDILGALLSEKADEMFNWLDGQSFIRRTSERGWFFHEKVRELMLRYLQKTNPSKLFNAHSKLDEYFSVNQSTLQLSLKDAYKSETWCNLEIEHVYHELSSNPEQNIQQTLSAFLDGFRWKRKFPDLIARIVQQVAGEKQSENLLGWVNVLFKFSSAYEQENFQDVIQKLNQLEEQKKLTITAQCCIFAQRGFAYHMVNKHEDALTDFTRAIEFDDKYTMAIAFRGLTYHEMKKYKEALMDFNRAIELDDKYTMAIINRGKTYLLMEKYQEALADFTQFIELSDEGKVVGIALRGLTYHEMKKYKEALTDFNRAIEVDDKFRWAITIRGETYHVMKKYHEALMDFNRAIELDEKDAWAIANRGETYRLMEKHEEALMDFNRALELNDKYVKAIVGRGGTYREMERLEEASMDFNRAIELDDKHDKAFAERAVLYFGMKKSDLAIEDLTRAIKIHEKQAGYYIARGTIYDFSGMYDEALYDFNRAIEFEGENASSFGQRAKIYQNMGKQEEALADFSHAIELGDKSPENFALRGQIYHNLKRFEKAITDFTQAIELDQQRAVFFALRGQTYELMQEYEKALADLTNAIELDENYTVAITQRGATYQSMKKHEEALADFTRVIELDDKNVWAFINRGKFYESIGRYEEAIADFTHSIELEPKDPKNLALRGQSYSKVNRYKEAITDLSQAIELDQQRVDFLGVRGQIYQLLQEYAEAIADFNRVIELDNTDIRSFIKLGEIYQAMGNFKEALINLNHVIELDNKNTQAIAQRGVTYQSMNKHEEALADFTRAIELDDKSTWIYLPRGICNEKLSKYEDALEDFRLALETDSNDTNNMANYAGLLLGLGTKDKGLEILDKAIQHLTPPNNTGLHVESLFYAFAHWDEDTRATALKNLNDVIINGARSDGWDFSQNLRQAREDRHPDIEWLEKLDRVITKGADVGILGAWLAWEDIE